MMMILIQCYDNEIDDYNDDNDHDDDGDSSNMVCGILINDRCEALFRLLSSDSCRCTCMILMMISITRWKLVLDVMLNR